MIEKLNFLKGTQASYNALTSKNENTFYRTSDKNLYLGDIHLNKQNVVFGTCMTRGDLANKEIVITDTSWTITEGAILFVQFAATNEVSHPKFKINNQLYSVYTARGNDIIDLDGLNPEIYTQGGDETQILSYVYHNNAFYCQADEPESTRVIIFSETGCSETFENVANALASQEKVYFFVRAGAETEGFIFNVHFAGIIQEAGVAGLLFTLRIPTLGEGVVIFAPDESVLINTLEPGSLTIGNSTWSEESGANADFTQAVNNLITAQITNKMDKNNPTGTGSFSINRKASTTVGNYSSTLGQRNTASGESSHAEGSNTAAGGYGSHTEGSNTVASGSCSHAEGSNTIASGNYSHAEGLGPIPTNRTISGDANATTYTINTTNSINVGSIINYQGTTATVTAYDSSARTITLDKTLSQSALVNASITAHSSGMASGFVSHAEGSNTVASGGYSHTEGYRTIASGEYSHVQGKYNIEDTEDKYAHIVGNGNHSKLSNAHSLDWDGNAWFAGDVYVGSISGTNKDNGSVKLVKETDLTVDNIDGLQDALENIDSNFEALAKNYYGTCGTLGNTATKTASITDYTLKAGNIITIKFTAYVPDNATLNITSTGAKAIYYKGAAITAYTITDGDTATFIYDGNYYQLISIDKGVGRPGRGIHSAIFNDYKNNKASGQYAHAEGESTSASGRGAHAEGDYTVAKGYAAHAEGSFTYANGKYSHAEGRNAIADGQYAHAEGYNTSAASQYQHAQGKYNLKDEADTYAHIVGNGTKDSLRSNAHTVDWSGNAWFAGDVYVGSTGGKNKDAGSKKLATEDYVVSQFALNDAMIYKGVLDGANPTTYTPAANAGHTYKVATAGLINGVAVQVGDMLICTTDNTAAATADNVATIAAQWNVIQTSDGTVTGPASSRALNGQIAVFDGTTGKLIKGSGKTVNSFLSTSIKTLTLDSLTINDSILIGTKKTSTATGDRALGIGQALTMSGENVIVHGRGSTATGLDSMASGYEAEATGDAAHAFGSTVTASGSDSFAAGWGATASKSSSFALGEHVTASSQRQFVIGTYNVDDASNVYAFIIGNGASGAKSNAFAVKWTGDAVFAGNVYSGSIADTNRLVKKSEIGAAAAKGVTDSASASAIGTSTNLVTERDIFYGLPSINNSRTYTSNTAIYAPTYGGTAGSVLRAVGATSAPIWESVIDSSSASAISTSSKLVTERDIYYGLPTINNSHSYTSSTTIYAPTAGGTAGQILIGKGTTTAPGWDSTLTVASGTGVNVTGQLSLDNAVKF